MKSTAPLILLTCLTLLTAAPLLPQNPAPPAPPMTPPPAVPSPTPPAPPAPPAKEIVVAWEASLMYLFEYGQLVHEPVIINVGMHGTLDPRHLGEHVIIEKMRLKRSNQYDVHGKPLKDPSVAEEQGAVMRYWMRVGRTAIGFHYSPAFRFHTAPSRRHRSHGCFRLRKETAQWLYDWTPRGTPVHVVKELTGTPWEFLKEKTPPELVVEQKPPQRQSEPASPH